MKFVDGLIASGDQYLLFAVSRPIRATDVAGYPRLIGADEEGTHERLKAHRRELVDPKIREHSGRIVNTAGDGILAGFPSVVDAVRCATVRSGGVARSRRCSARPALLT